MVNEKTTERIKGLVKNEVLTCQSSLVEMLLQQGIISYDEITNFYTNNNDEVEEKNQELEELKSNKRYLELDEKYSIDGLIPEEEKEYNKLEKEIDWLEDRLQELENEQGEPQEILEWWVVSDWLAEELEKNGEPILRSDYETWWGRTCSGQSLELDYIIKKIAEDLEQ